MRSNAQIEPHPDLALAYTYNRFQASRFGLSAEFIDVAARSKRPLVDDLIDTLNTITPTAMRLDGERAIRDLLAQAHRQENDADWLRHIAGHAPSLAHVVLRQTERWRDG